MIEIERRHRVAKAAYLNGIATGGIVMAVFWPGAWNADRTVMLVCMTVVFLDSGYTWIKAARNERKAE